MGVKERRRGYKNIWFDYEDTGSKSCAVDLAIAAIIITVIIFII